MKALIKGGICLALGWLASGASAQDIQWRSANPKNAGSSLATPPPGFGAACVHAGSVAKRRSPDAPLGAGAFQPIIRAQAPDDKVLQVEPLLENDPKVAKPLPRDKNFVPPPPSPVFGNLGVVAGDGQFDGDALGLGRIECCPPRPRFWASAEYLMWWQRAQAVPPLVTSGVFPALVPGTTVLYDRVPEPSRSGGRFTLGTMVPHFGCNLGIEVSYFTLDRASDTSAYSSNGTTILGRPFTDVTPIALGGNPGLSAELIAPGSVTIQSYSQLWGIESNLRYKWRCGSKYWIDLIGGYRHLNLSEGIDITESQVLNQNNQLTAFEQESFRTRNQFNGFQFGLECEHRFWNRWFFGSTTKVATGMVHQSVNIDGSTTYAANGFGPFTGQGALLASPTNIGRYTQNRFGVLPEVGFKLGCDVTNHLRIYAGYNFLYLSSVLRAGEQIDLNVNQAFRPKTDGQPGFGNTLPAAQAGPRSPEVLMRTSGYWAQGMTFGLMYRY